MVKSEGGDCEEIIDEESGILISAMLRQYFMALRTIGKWQKLSDHWMHVASNVHHEPLESKEDKAEAKAASEEADPDDREGTWHDFLKARLGHTKVPHDEDTDFAEDDDDTGMLELDEEHDSAVEVEVGADPDTQMDIEILLQRKFFTRWARKAGVKTCPCDPVGEGDCLVDWTRLIAPIVDGRIKMVESA